jgi:RNA polymerase sigma factor (sigma-70 family)
VPTQQLAPVLHYLRQVGGAPDPADGALLERYVRDGDGSAFAALVRRHGPLVWGVCRRLVRHLHDAEDAFQAVFFVLARKAGSLRRPERLGPWLYGVACRTARKALALTARRRREGPVADVAAPTAPDDLAWRELRPLLDDAIDRLPEKYRTPIVLCYLEGLTHAQAARRLGCPPGTVATRLARARERLRARLLRQGVAPSAAALAVAVGAHAAAAAPAALVERAVHAAGWAASRAAASAAPPAVAALTEGVCQAMLMQKGKMVLAVLAMALFAGVGLGFLHGGRAAESPGRQEVKPAPLAPREDPPVHLVGFVDQGTVEEATSTDWRAAPPDETGPVTSPNFVVDAPSRRVAQLIAEAAERQRKERALQWLGKELPNWSERCPIKVKFTMDAPGGMSTVTYVDGRVGSRRMDVQGPLDQLLSSVLPHEVTHLVFADYFKGSAPRWADEGGAVMSDDSEVRAQHAKALQRVLREPGRAIPLRRLLAMSDYPRDAGAFFAQSLSLTAFLVERKDRKTFLAFVKQGMRDDWDQALHSHYGLRDVAELEAEWLAQFSVRPPSKAETPPGEGKDRRDPAPLREDDRLRDPPRMTRARLDADGRIYFPKCSFYYEPVTTYQKGEWGNPDTAVTSYRLRRTLGSSSYPARVVRAYGADGKEIAGKALAARLRKETPVLVSDDGEMIDPEYRSLLRDDALILVLPAPDPPPATTPDPPGAM